MSIVGQNYDELFGMAKSCAVAKLGGAAGQDYAYLAEDLAQDVIVLLLEKEAEGTLVESEVFGLCKRMAELRSISLHKLETRRREIEQENGESINSGLDGSREYLSADPMEIMAYEEMRSRLDELSPKLYNAVERHYIDGRSVTDIAEEDGVSEDVIYKRLQRARDEVTGDNNNE